LLRALTNSVDITNYKEVLKLILLHRPFYAAKQRSAWEEGRLVDQVCKVRAKGHAVSVHLLGVERYIGGRLWEWSSIESNPRINPCRTFMLTGALSKHDFTVAARAVIIDTTYNFLLQMIIF
jgi:hypothetical protein